MPAAPTRSSCVFLFSLLAAGALAQSAGDSDAGSRLSYDPPTDSARLSWWGATGHTYFVEQSPDLKQWDYLILIETGEDDIIEYESARDADKRFFRLQYTDIPTTDPEGDDFDGDGYGNLAELTAGSDPFDIHDTPQPTAPSEVSGRAQSDGTTRIEWTDNSDNETVFSIRYSTNGGASWAELTTTEADTETVILNESFEAGTQFQVAAVNSEGIGYTGESEATTIVPLPSLSYALIEVAAFDPTDDSEIIDIGKSGQILWRVGEEKDSRLLYSNWSSQPPDTLYRYFSFEESELIDFYLNRHNSTIDDVYFPDINGSYPSNIELFADGVVIFSTRADTVTVNSNINAENLLKTVSFSNGTSVVEDYFDPMVQNQLTEIETTESGRTFGYWKDLWGDHPIDHDTNPGIRIEVNSDGSYNVIATHTDSIVASPNGTIFSVVSPGESLYQLNNQGLRWYSGSTPKVVFPDTATEYTAIPSLLYVSSDSNGNWTALTNSKQIWTRRPDTVNPGQYVEAFDGPYDLGELLNSSEWTNFGTTHMNAAGMIATTAEKVVDGVPSGNHSVVLLLKMDITAEDSNGNDLAANPNGSFTPPFSPATPELAIPVPGYILEFSEATLFSSALVVFYRDVIEEVDDEWELKDFDIKFNLPDGLTGVQWSQKSGPTDSGTLIDANKPKAIFRNPTKGGLYEFELSISGNLLSTFQVWLPVAGPGIESYWQSEINYFKNIWGPLYRENLISSIPTMGGRPFLWSAVRREKALRDILEYGFQFDWTGLVPGEKTPSGGPGDEPGFEYRQTLHGVTIDFRKRNNMLYALIGREMGIEEVFLKRGPNTVGLLGGASGAPDDQYAFEAYEAGFDLFDGVSLSDVMKNRGIEMQFPDQWSAREWPSYETSDGELFRAAYQQLFDLINND